MRQIVKRGQVYFVSYFIPPGGHGHFIVTAKEVFEAGEFFAEVVQDIRSVKGKEEAVILSFQRIGSEGEA